MPALNQKLKCVTAYNVSDASGNERSRLPRGRKAKAIAPTKILTYGLFKLPIARYHWLKPEQPKHD
jgi:hypothetical protein